MAKDGKRTDQRAREAEAQDRAAHGQSAALGDTGDRQTGVETGHQGISNRSGDRPEDESTGDGEGGDKTARGRDTGGEAQEAPVTEAGAPPEQDFPRTSLDSPSQMGRPRADVREEKMERSGRQETPRSDPEATRPLGSPTPDDNTM